MEQIRIIKEMRESDRQRGRSGQLVRCRFCVWENVVGAMSSNSGRDFQAVLTEFVKVSQPDAPDVPMPEKGKWPKSGWLYDDLGRWSVAWRVTDAQYHGVPQRRRRIALVADFNGLTAPTILFDPQYRRETEDTESNETFGDIGDGDGKPNSLSSFRKGLSGDSEPSGETGEETAGGTGGGVASASQSVGWPLGFRPENVRTYEECATTLCNVTRPGFTCGVIDSRDSEPKTPVQTLRITAAKEC